MHTTEKGPTPPDGGGHVNARLMQLRSFSEPGRGFTETHLTPRIGGGLTMAVLSSPLGPPNGFGWVVCHGFGTDQINLPAIEVPLTRALAARGFQVLRFHAQGFGDSELPTEHASLASMVSDACDATRVLRDAADVDRFGIFGAKLGGTVAALAAERTDAVALALWDPVVRGKTYATRLARLSSASELVTRGSAQAQGRDPMSVMGANGFLDVQGIRLTKQLFDEFSDVDLTRALTRFERPSLIVQPSRNEQPRPDLEALTSRLGELGGRPTFRIVADSQADKFGQPRFVGRGDGSKTDEMEQLAASLIDATVSWCVDLVEGRG